VLEEHFQRVYLKFKINLYSKVFAKFETREASLTTVETFCAEIIHALSNPTVNEFAQFVNISAQNATHKINSLVRKGYVAKWRSPEDKREFRLSATDKFFQYYNISTEYVHEVIRRMYNRCDPEDLIAFDRVLEIIDRELMPEVVIGNSGTDV
jgi:DNA-binding MarR family transcriptional regulator